MLLERVDINSHGPLKRLGLGPFSHQLNVIQAGHGEGKTAWVRFLRDSLTGTTPTAKGLALSQGRAVWLAADGAYHYHRQPNGTDQGRRWVTFQSRSSGSDRERPNVVIDVPAKIVDGIVTDTWRTSPRQVVAAAIDAGLDGPVTGAWSGWPQTHQAEIVELQAELAALNTQLRQLAGPGNGQTQQPLRDRLAALTLELSAIDARREFASRGDALLAQRRDERHRLARLVEDVDTLRRRERELKERLAELDTSLANLARETRHDQVLTAILGIAQDRMRWFNRQIQAIGDLVRDVERLAEPTNNHDSGPVWNPDSVFVDRLAAVGRAVDRLVGGLEADQRHWLESDRDDDPLAGDILSETDQWLQRERRREIGLGTEPDELTPPGSDDSSADPGWLEDSVRRSRIDSLRRAERRRRLHELADGGGTSLGTHGALLSTLRSIAATLHGISHRLSGSRSSQAGTTSVSDGSLRAVLQPCSTELRLALDGLTQARSALATRIARTQRLPLDLLESLASGVPSTQAGATDIDLAASKLSPLPDAEETWTLGAAPSEDDSAARVQARIRREQTRLQLERKRRDLAQACRQTVRQMTAKLAEAESLHRTDVDALVQQPTCEDQRRRDELEHEIRRLQARLANPEMESLRQRHQACWERLQQLQIADEASTPPMSPLAQAACDYLERLSGGRLRDIRWRSSSNGVVNQDWQVTVDGQDERNLAEPDRFLAALAVRLAGSDELARRGRPLPLLIETPDFDRLIESVWQPESVTPAQAPIAVALPTVATTNRHLVAVLAEVASRGRQIIVLTPSASLAEVIVRFGGRGFTLTGAVATDPPIAERANREFDIDWRQNFGSETAGHGVPKQPIATDGFAFDEPQSVVPFPLHRRSDQVTRDEVPRNPFFLTVTSPIEQAPSIDADTAGRLRELGILSVSQLLESSPARLAERLRVRRISAAAIRDWQAECRLMCGVQGLRGFDARVLVGCGIIHPRQVAEIEPADLVERVESFLGTDQGARILRSGTRQEISRLTRWIQQAKGQQPATGGLKFYLNRRSPVQDAPSIGPRMAERLAKLRIHTVDDLLKADAARIATGLKVRQVDEATVRGWQQQAILVCRVPSLRGHDAQLLVAAGITQPQQLAECEPSWLLRQILPISRSGAGKRILRGGKEPDLTEVTDWIRHARRRRELRAAS